MSVDIIFPSSVPRYVSSQQIRTLASPFPPVGSVAAPCGSPAVPHLRRYYRVVRLLQHPSVLPPVDPWLHVPLDPLLEAVLLVCEEMVSSLRFLGHPCGACPGLETPASRPDLAITVAARYCLPLAQTRRPRNDRNFGADPHGLLPCCLRFDTHQSPGEWQDSLLICLLDFDQAGFAPAG